MEQVKTWDIRELENIKEFQGQDIYSILPSRNKTIKTNIKVLYSSLILLDFLYLFHIFCLGL